MNETLFENKWVSFTPLFILTIFIIIYAIAQGSFIESRLHFGSAECEAREKKNPKDKCAIEPDNVFSVVPDLFDKEGNLIKDQNQQDVASRKAITERYNGRLFAMFMIAAHLLFCLAAFLVCFLLLWKLQGYKWALGIVAASIPIGFILSLMDSMPIMAPVLNATVDNLSGGVDGIVRVIKVANSIAYAATLTFVVTNCLNLYPKKLSTDENSTDEKTDEKRKKDKNLYEEPKKEFQILADKKANLEMLLYLSMILLVVGVLRMTAMGNWSVTFMTPDTAKIASTFFAHVTTVIGGFFSLLLMGGFVPAIYILQQQRKARLDYYEEKGIEVAEIAKSAEHTFSIRDSLPKIIAIIAPLLTGPIAEVIKSLIPAK